MQQRALWTLEHADELPPRDTIEGMRSQLRLWHYSSSGAYTTWSVILPVGRNARNKRPVVREVVWDRGRDRGRAISGVEKLRLRSKGAPSIRVRDAEVAWEDLAPFMEEATRLTAAPPVPRRKDIRGDRYGIEGFRSMAYLRVEWEDEGPPEWAASITWISRLRKLLISAVNARA
ncbi:MAG: hypothetical protein HYY16_14310 [Planctomycetes bacterium]|nr:hypothetical protein [Planctomycetota bacterium]